MLAAAAGEKTGPLAGAAVQLKSYRAHTTEWQRKEPLLFITTPLHFR